MRRRTGFVVLALCGVALVCASLAASVTLLSGIRSPSGNIRCLYVPGARIPSGGHGPSAMLCNIGQADYAKTLQAHCSASPIGLDWHGFMLGATAKGSVTCSGGILYNPDTQRPTYVTLPYGKSWQHGVFTCWSRVTGVTCRSRAGHGLFISRQAWRGF